MTEWEVFGVKRTIATVLVLLLAVSLAAPAESAEGAAEGADLLLPLEEDVPEDIIAEIERRRVQGYLSDRKARESDVSSETFVYGGGYEVLVPDPYKTEPDKVDSILDIQGTDAFGEVKYVFLGYLDGGPKFVFTVTKGTDGTYSIKRRTDHYYLSNVFAVAFERAGLALAGCDGKKYVSYFGSFTKSSGEYAVYAVDGKNELMSICCDPANPPPTEERVFAGSANATPVVFEAVDFARHLAVAYAEDKKRDDEYRREHGMSEDEILFSAPPDISGFVPTHIVDVDALNSAEDGGAGLYALAAASAVIVVAGGAAALWARRRRS